MQLAVHYDSKVLGRFGKLPLCLGLINNVRVEKHNEQIRRLKNAVYAEVVSKYNVEALKDNPVVRAYRDFYWKLNIDPTKTRPSGEALLRRILNQNELPNVSTVVDAYNLASMKTIVPISGFDLDRLNPPFTVRFAVDGEALLGIGMDRPITLTENMLVLTDEKKVLCIYPYRDSNETKINLSTQNVLVIGYGAPGITEERLEEAVTTTLSYIKQVSGGDIRATKVFSSEP
jgi:DNA/RNA-binding domain of Phe-tRNA-synthetase-like protein